MKMAVATVFVNGLFNPKSEEVWEKHQKRLEGIFECKAFHVHNPTLATELSMEKLTNPTAKFGASMFALGAMASMAYDAYQGTDYTTKAVGITMDGVKSNLEKQSKSVAQKIEDEVDTLLTGKPDIKKINLVGHSHGGWSTAVFIQQKHAHRLALKHGVTFNVVILGCPVLVQPGAGVSTLVQLHNKLDPVSLRYADKTAIGKSNEVVSAQEAPYHECTKYLDWLEAHLKT